MNNNKEILIPEENKFQNKYNDYSFDAGFILEKSCWVKFTFLEDSIIAFYKKPLPGRKKTFYQKKVLKSDCDEKGNAKFIFYSSDEKFKHNGEWVFKNVLYRGTSWNDVKENEEWDYY